MNLTKDLELLQIKSRGVARLQFGVLFKLIHGIREFSGSVSHQRINQLCGRRTN